LAVKEIVSLTVHQVFLSLYQEIWYSLFVQYKRIFKNVNEILKVIQKHTKELPEKIQLD